MLLSSGKYRIYFITWFCFLIPFQTTEFSENQQEKMYVTVFGCVQEKKTANIEKGVDREE